MKHVNKLPRQTLRFRVPGIELKRNPQIRKTTKKYENNSRNSPPGVGPRKYETKNTEKIRKRSFSGNFRLFFPYIFCILGARPGVGYFVILAAQKSHRKIAVTTVAASGLATIPLQKSQGFSLWRPQKNR